MKHLSQEALQSAKNVNLLTYLMQCDPQELVHVAGSTYCTREHDSLKISNGMWYWFSRGIGGRSALDYLIKVKGIPFTEAVGMILGRAAEMPPVSHIQTKSRALPQAQNQAGTQTLQEKLGKLDAIDKPESLDKLRAEHQPKKGTEEGSSAPEAGGRQAGTGDCLSDRPGY